MTVFFLFLFRLLPYLFRFLYHFFCASFCWHKKQNQKITPKCGFWGPLLDQLTPDMTANERIRVWETDSESDYYIATVRKWERYDMWVLALWDRKMRQHSLSRLLSFADKFPRNVRTLGPWRSYVSDACPIKNPLSNADYSYVFLVKSSFPIGKK